MVAPWRMRPASWLICLCVARLAAADLVVFGGTPAGIAAAVAAARQGLTVEVVEPTPWIGGMVAGGLSRTDVGRADTVGGFAREFFTRAAAAKPGTPMWYAEPSANLRAFQAYLAEAKARLTVDRRVVAVRRDGSRIVAFTDSAGEEHVGAFFVDASYEGDLMAAAGVTHVVGREGRAEFAEPLAGYQPMPVRPRSVETMSTPCPSLGGKGPAYVHGTPAVLSGVDARGEPIAGVMRDPGLRPGDPDDATQSYNYRVVVTRAADRVPFPRPADYDQARYELLVRLVAAFPEIPFGRLFHLGEIAGDKYDLNAQGLFSTDLPGGSFAYPAGTHEERERIRREHRSFTEGLFWFLAHDPRVPARLREETAAWGLCRDEFADNGHWPYALYVREGRRMRGEYVLRQADLQNDVRKADGIGMGSFVIDCHIVRRILAPDGTVRDEGSFQDAPVVPYQIPYRSIVPRRAECANLLVPVCLSATHVAVCSLRMEPVYMAMGQASGLAAALAKRTGRSVQDIDVEELRRQLRAAGAVLELAGVGLWPRSAELPGVVRDDASAEKTGHWISSGFGSPIDGTSIHDGAADKGASTATFVLAAAKGGRHAVRFAYVSAPNRAAAVPVRVVGPGLDLVRSVDQRKAAPGGFVTLAEAELKAGDIVRVIVSNAGTVGFVGADAAQLLPLGP